jgi:hypothetical protein
MVVHCLHAGPVEEVALQGQLVGSSVSLKSEWEPQFGVHGGNSEGTLHLVNWTRLVAWGAVLLWSEVSILLAAFFFDSWAAVVALTAALALLGIVNLFQTNPVPRSVRKKLENAADQSASSKSGQNDESQSTGTPAKR